jgi:hypothetical protein
MPAGPLTSEDRAADRAFKRGVERGEQSSLMAQHIQDDARQFGEIRTSLAQGATEMHGLRDGLAALKADFVKFVTEAETRADAAKELAEAAKERAEGQLQVKQFYIGLVAAVLTLVGILEGTGHA